MRRVTLSTARPLGDLRAAVGAGGKPLSGAALARARGVAQASAQQAEASGGAIGLDTLQAYVEAVGGTLEIRATLPDGPAAVGRTPPKS